MGKNTCGCKTVDQEKMFDENARGKRSPETVPLISTLLSTKIQSSFLITHLHFTILCSATSLFTIILSSVSPLSSFFIFTIGLDTISILFYIPSFVLILSTLLSCFPYNHCNFHDPFLCIINLFFTSSSIVLL
jgi:hypothetical protein